MGAVAVSKTSTEWSRSSQAGVQRTCDAADPQATLECGTGCIVEALNGQSVQATHQSSRPKRSLAEVAGAVGAATAAGRPAAARRCCRKLCDCCFTGVPASVLLPRCRQWAWGATATPEPRPPAAATLGGGARHAALEASGIEPFLALLADLLAPPSKRKRRRLAQCAGPRP